MTCCSISASKDVASRAVRLHSLLCDYWDDYRKYQGDPATLYS